jgi:hypothetical protein
MIIASRVLKLRSPAGVIDIPIRIFKPEEAKRDTWSCGYEIEWPDGRWQNTSWGVDSIQALFNAFQMIGSEIYTSNFHKSGDLYLDAPERGYGFPVPGGLRHLLRGDDADFL